MRREEDGCRLPFSGVFSDVVASPLPPRGGGDRAEARRGGRSKLEEGEVLGLGLNLEPMAQTYAEDGAQALFNIWMWAQAYGLRLDGWILSLIIIIIYYYHYYYYCYYY